MFDLRLRSRAKKIVLFDMYEHILKMSVLMKFEYQPAFLILPGRSDREAKTIRAFFPDAHVTAIDSDAKAIEAIRGSKYIDRAIYGDVHKINCWHEPESLRDEHFLSANCDMCAPYRSEGIASPTPFRMAKRATFFSIFVSYGLDRRKMGPTIASDYFHENIAAYPRWKNVASLSRNIASRLINIAKDSQVETGKDVLRIYLYRGNRMPMLGMLCAPTFVREYCGSDQIQVVNFHNSDYSSFISEKAKDYGNIFMADALDEDIKTIVAHKAIATARMRRRKP